MHTKKKQSIFIFIFTIILIANLTVSLSAHTWKIFWYMDSSDELSDMAIKNMTDAARGKPNNKVELVIQLHAYHNVGLRYKITEDNLQFLDEIILSGNSKQDFIDACTWAFNGNTADHTMLIMANHGWGILEPQWNTITQEWEVEEGGLSNSCMIKRNGLMYRNLIEQHKRHRGFMFSTSPRTYLTNQDMANGLKILKDTILTGKKLDIIAFDTCMGDMFEIA